MHRFGDARRHGDFGLGVHTLPVEALGVGGDSLAQAKLSADRRILIVARGDGIDCDLSERGGEFDLGHALPEVHGIVSPGHGVHFIEDRVAKPGQPVSHLDGHQLIPLPRSPDGNVRRCR